MFCKYCGNQIPDNQINCPMCGANLSAPQVNNQNAAPNTPYAQNAPVRPVNEPNVYIRKYKPKLGYEPIGMWGYFGFNLLFMIPVVGFICIILFSCGVSRNANIRNYARSFLCIYIIAAAVIAILGFGFGMLWNNV